jgi:AcrR family transcriptional regulator
MNLMAATDKSNSNPMIKASADQGEASRRLDTLGLVCATVANMKQRALHSEQSANAPNGEVVDKRERTRQAIIATSLTLIAEKGIDDTSVLDVTNALGISNGAFYYHFRNKDHLLEEVGHTVVENLVARIESVSRADPAEQVGRGPLIIIEYCNENPELWPIILRVVVDQGGIHESLHHRLHGHLTRGRHVGRFGISDVDLAVAFCRSIIAGALQKFRSDGDAAQLGIQASAHTLAMLGLPLWEAFALAEQEHDKISAESDGLVGTRAF